MNRFLPLFLVLIFLAAIASPVSGAAPAVSPPSAPLRIGVVLSVGGLGDHSFNDVTYEGIQQLRSNLGALVEVVEPGNVGDIEPALDFLAGQKPDLVVAVGLFANEAVRQVAQRHPAVSFLLLDSVVTQPNVLSVLFNEEEGSFFAGALAGLVTKTGKVGFLGGMVSPVIEAFERGFKNGVAFVNPKGEVLVRYAGNTPEAFNNPERGKKLAQELNALGADLIYHASGRTGLGLIQAARQGPFLVIGVDTDQSALAPGKIPASMVKRLDIALDKAVRLVIEKRFQGGVLTLGLADAGVGLAYSRFNKNLLTPLIQDRLREVENFLQHRVKQ